MFNNRLTRRMIDAGIGATRAAARAKSPDGFARWQACCRGDTAAEEFSYDERNICAGESSCACSTSGRMVGDEAIIAAGESEPCVEQLRFVLPDLVPGIQALLASKEG